MADELSAVVSCLVVEKDSLLTQTPSHTSHTGQDIRGRILEEGY